MTRCGWKSAWEEEEEEEATNVQKKRREEEETWYLYSDRKRVNFHNGRKSYRSVLKPWMAVEQERVFGCLEAERTEERKTTFRVYNFVKQLSIIARDIERRHDLDGDQSGIKWWGCEEQEQILVGGGEGVPPPLCWRKRFWMVVHQQAKRQLEKVDNLRWAEEVRRCVYDVLDINCEKTTTGRDHCSLDKGDWGYWRLDES